METCSLHVLRQMAGVRDTALSDVSCRVVSCLSVKEVGVGKEGG
jgi:hypothetical protein